MNRGKAVVVLYGVIGAAFLVSGLETIVTSGMTLGAVLLILGSLLNLGLSGRQLLRGEFEEWNNDVAFWLVGFASVCVVVGVALQFV